MATGSPRPRIPAARSATASAAPPAAPFTAPTLVRLLARLAGPDTPAAGAPFAERLGQWLHWTDAAALSEALDGTVAPTPAPPGAATDVDALALTLRRTRETMARTIEADCSAARTDLGDDYAAWRRLVVNRQQAVQAGLAPLRARLRGALVAHSPALGRLAEVDTVMERAVGARERALLGATLPSLLQHHFERLRAGDADGWRDPFCRDLHELLMAALDLCLQPLEGLLAALQAAPSPVP